MHNFLSQEPSLFPAFPSVFPSFHEYADTPSVQNTWTFSSNNASLLTAIILKKFKRRIKGERKLILLLMVHGFLNNRLFINVISNSIILLF